MRILHSLSLIGLIALTACDRGVAPQNEDSSVFSDANPITGSTGLVLGDNASLQRAVRQIQRDLSTMRNLPFDQPVVSSWVRRTRLMSVLDSIDGSFQEPVDTSSGPHPTATEIFVALDMMDGKRSAENDQRAFDSANIEGFYITGTNKFWLVEDADRPDERTYSLMAHELAHAMQYQNFHDRIRRDAGSDEYLAYKHLIEGEAEYLGDLWSLPGRTGDEFEASFRRFTLDQALVAAANDHPETPLVLLLPVYSQYWVSEWSIHDQRMNAGWAAIDALHETLPRSTKRMLHPFVGSTAQSFVEWPENVFGNHQNLVPLGSDRLGEVYLASMAHWRMTSLSWNSSSWKGDRFWAWRAADSLHHVVAGRIRFENSVDAGQFLTKWAMGRSYPIQRMGETDSVYQNNSDTGLVRAVRRGADLTVLFGAYPGGWPAGLADSMWSELAAANPTSILSARRTNSSVSESGSDVPGKANFPKFPSAPIRIWKDYSPSMR